MGGQVVGSANEPTTKVASGVWRPSYIAARISSGLAFPLGADPSFSSVVALYHFNVPNGTGGIVDWSSKSHDASQVLAGLTSTAKFGTAAGYVNGSHYISAASHADFNVGTGDFTLEGWFYFASLGVNCIALDQRSNEPQVRPMVYVTTAGSLRYYVNGADRITGSNSQVTTATYHHIAVSRASGSTKLFLNGTQQGSTYTDSNTYTQGPLNVGAGVAPAVSSGMTGAIDEIRFTVGVGRYTANFTAPTTPFPDY